MLLAIACAGGAVALAIRHYHEPRPAGVDADAWRWLGRWLLDREPGWGPVADALGIGLPILVVAVVGIAAWRAGLRRAALLVMLAPLIVSLLVRFVLKPVTQDPTGWPSGYPSGHTAAATTTALALVVVAFGPGSPVRRQAHRRAIVVLAVVWSLLVAYLMIALHYHYLTETVGAFAVSIVLVVVVALTIDAVAAVAAGREPAAAARRQR